MQSVYYQNLDYEVHAITGKPDENEKLNSMGATKIIARNDFMSEPLNLLIKHHIHQLLILLVEKC